MQEENAQQILRVIADTKKCSLTQGLNSIIP